MKTKAEVNAAVLVAIIAGLIVLYILFLPAEETRELLEGNLTDDDDDDDVDEEVLLSEKPGRLAFIKETELEHVIPPMNLFTSTEATVLKSVNSLYVKNGVFDKAAKAITFTIGDLDNTKNVILSFELSQHKGRLIIKLNGYEVFDGEIIARNIEPLILSDGYLRNENTLEISVSDVGFMFWKTNEYSLENLKVLADVTDISARRGSGVFFMEGSEVQNIRSSKLKFFPDCEVRRVSRLDISINNYNILSSIPDCGMLQIVEFSPFILVEGENKIVFKTDKGQYLIDRILVDTELKGTPSYVQYFELDEDQIQSIEDDEMDVNLMLIFVDRETEKEADIIINGRKTIMPLQREISFSKKINMYVEEGTNSVKIIPRKTLDIKELKVELIET